MIHRRYQCYPSWPLGLWSCRNSVHNSAPVIVSGTRLPQALPHSLSDWLTGATRHKSCDSQFWDLIGLEQSHDRKHHDSYSTGRAWVGRRGSLFPSFVAQGLYIQILGHRRHNLGVEGRCQSHLLVNTARLTKHWNYFNCSI